MDKKEEWPSLSWVGEGAHLPSCHGITYPLDRSTNVAPVDPLKTDSHHTNETSLLPLCLSRGYSVGAIFGWTHTLFVWYVHLLYDHCGSFSYHQCVLGLKIKIIKMCIGFFTSNSYIGPLFSATLYFTLRPPSRFLFCFLSLFVIGGKHVTFNYSFIRVGVVKIERCFWNSDLNKALK